MSTKNKIMSINKRLNTIFKDIKSLPFEDINKILFNIELLKNKYLHRTKQGDFELYEEEEDIKLVDLKAMIDSLKAEGVLGNRKRQDTIPYQERPSRFNKNKE